MKKTTILALVLVLTLSMLTGCGRRRREPAETAPMATSAAPSAAPTEMTTVPTENTTHATENVIIPDVTGGTDTPATDNPAAGNADTTENTNSRAKTVR